MDPVKHLSLLTCSCTWEAELGRGWICGKLQGTLWKEAFPVGTEWDQYDKVYEINWDFTNLEVKCIPGSLVMGFPHSISVLRFVCFLCMRFFWA